mgnify:CR=1 FL=1
MASRRRSCRYGPTSCTPTGSPSVVNAAGNDSASVFGGYYPGYYGGYGGYGSGYGAGGEGCGGINCEGDGWDGGYENMKDAERETSSQDVQFDKEFGKKSRLCKSKTPQYNDWGDFTGYKAVKIPC